MPERLVHQLKPHRVVGREPEAILHEIELQRLHQQALPVILHFAVRIDLLRLNPCSGVCGCGRWRFRQIGIWQSNWHRVR